MAKAVVDHPDQKIKEAVEYLRERFPWTEEVVLRVHPDRAWVETKAETVLVTGKIRAEYDELPVS